MEAPQAVSEPLPGNACSGQTPRPRAEVKLLWGSCWWSRVCPCDLRRRCCAVAPHVTRFNELLVRSRATQFSRHLPPFGWRQVHAKHSAFQSGALVSTSRNVLDEWWCAAVPRDSASLRGASSLGWPDRASLSRGGWSFKRRHSHGRRIVREESRRVEPTGGSTFDASVA